MAKKNNTGQRFHVYLARELHHALLQRALDESAKAGKRVTASAIVNRLLERYLSKKGAQS